MAVCLSASTAISVTAAAPVVIAVSVITSSSVGINGCDQHGHGHCIRDGQQLQPLLPTRSHELLDDEDEVRREMGLRNEGIDGARGERPPCGECWGAEYVAGRHGCSGAGRVGAETGAVSGTATRGSTCTAVKWAHVFIINE